MKILSLESSCDETAAAVIEDGRKILSSIVATQVEEHKLYGGVVPEIASRRHCEAVTQVTDRALKEAGLSIKEIDAVAVTYAPGLIGALLVGVNFAKGLCMAADKPLIPVHHLRGHIAANYLTSPNLKPPFMCLVVSGGHTHIVKVDDYTKLTVLGQTRDDAAGEAFDKAARAMGMKYPGGIELDKRAEDGNENAYKLPHPHVTGSEYDFSFSGLKTAVINLIHNSQQRGENINLTDLSASYRKAVVDCLEENVKKAMKKTGNTKLVIAGGVSANRLLRRRLTDLCQNNGWKFFCPEISLCGDNAAMIGSQAYYEYLKGHTAGLDLNAKPHMAMETNVN